MSGVYQQADSKKEYPGHVFCQGVYRINTGGREEMIFGAGRCPTGIQVCNPTGELAAYPED